MTSPKLFQWVGSHNKILMYDNWEERGKPFEGIGGGVVK